MKIVCFGDSLTRGVSYVKGRLRILKNNYPAMLQQLFDNQKEGSDEEGIQVLNKGVFNDNSDLLMRRLEKDLMGENPEFAIIGIGGNDCAFQWKEVAQYPEEEHEAIVPLDRYIKNLGSLIEKTKQSGITPILLTLPPLDPVRYYASISNRVGTGVSGWICKVGGIEHWHGNYNRALNKLAEEMGVNKIDARSALKRAGDLVDLISEDGIHLTEKGYKVMAAEIYENVVSVMEVGKKRVASM